MKVCIVGATGVLGRALVPQLREAGHEVRALVRDADKGRLYVGSDAEIVQCDLLEQGIESRMTEMLAGCEAAIHAATAIPRDFTAPGAWENNTKIRTKGTGRFQRAALNAGVKRYLQQSIVMAYKDGGDNWIDESTWIDSSPEREQTCKPVAIMESMMRLVKPEQMEWSILKCGQFVGPHTFQDDMVERVKQGKELIPGDGMNYLSLVHVEDVAAGFVAALEKAPASSIFNICDEPIRQVDYVYEMAERLGAPEPQHDVRQPRPPSFRCTSQRAREVLGWQPRHSIWPEVNVEHA